MHPASPPAVGGASSDDILPDGKKGELIYSTPRCSSRATHEHSSLSQSPSVSRAMLRAIALPHLRSVVSLRSTPHDLVISSEFIIALNCYKLIWIIVLPLV